MPRASTALALSLAASALAAPLRLEPLAARHPQLASRIATAAEAAGIEEDLSGAASFWFQGRERLALAGDEGSRVALLDVSAPGEIRILDLTDLLPGSVRPDEIDLEAAAFAGGRLFLAGSASLKRKKADKKKAEKNRARLADVGPASGRHEGMDLEHSNFLYVLGDLSTHPHMLERVELRQALLAHELLAPFAAVPSKDNGLDIEGLALGPDGPLLGLRGPVLRGMAVVAQLSTTGEGPTLRFLDLDGRGIRAMLEDPAPGLDRGEVLVLAGPTMPLEASYALFVWDGKSDVWLGRRDDADRRSPLRKLGEVEPPVPGAKPEALVTLGRDLVVFFDGVEGGAPHRILLSD